MRVKGIDRARFKRKNTRNVDPLFADVEWIVTGQYAIITSRGPIDCVRMRATLSNTFSIHVSSEYLKRYFYRIPEKCYSWRDNKRCRKPPNHAGAHKYAKV